MTLFLHGGPGLNTFVERRWFGDDLPIRWWDQPALAPDEQGTLTGLTRSAVKEVVERSNSSGKPVPIVAHSYGGHIARAVAVAVPERVAEIVLISCGVSLPSQFLLWGQSMALRHPDSAGLISALDGARRNPELKSMLTLVGAIASVPNFDADYFSNNSNGDYDRYLHYAKDAPAPDFSIFAAAFAEHLAVPPMPAPVQYSGTVRAFFGRDDPLVDMASASDYWRATFSNIQVEFEQGSHALHLELPPTRWLPVDND